jgi:hypothetical protein
MKTFKEYLMIAEGVQVAPMGLIDLAKEKNATVTKETNGKITITIDGKNNEFPNEAAAISFLEKL